MMDSKRGEFVPMTDIEVRRNNERLVPKPMIHDGEVVEVKGVKFRVTYWKPNGKLGLRMIPTETV